MDKRDLLLAAMAAGDRAKHSPVQIQKLMFLLDRNLGEETKAAGFEFVPYDYGPFDASIYGLLQQLEFEGLAASEATERGWKRYALTPMGQDVGLGALAHMPQRASQYIREVSQFVLRLSFAELVSAIYKAYPEMKVNSVFKG